MEQRTDESPRLHGGRVSLLSMPVERDGDSVTYADGRKCALLLGQGSKTSLFEWECDA